MRNLKYVLFEPGGRQISGYSYGKLVERRYIDIQPTETASADLDEFLTLLRATQNEMGPVQFRECRIGHVDENGAGRYFDPLEFLENEGQMPLLSEPQTQ